MNLEVIKQVADIVSKLNKKELESLLSVDGSVVVNSDNVSLTDVELHSTTDEDYYETLIEIAKGYGWEVHEWNILCRDGIRLSLESFYILGDFDGFVIDDGSYLDLESGRIVGDLEREILQNVENGKYSIINIKKDILDKNIDCISKLLDIEEGVDMDDNSGSYFYCTLKESLESMSNPYDCLKYFPNKDTVVNEVEINANAARAIRLLYKNMVDGFFVMDNIGYKVFGYDYSGFCNYSDRDSITRFEVRTGLSGYDSVVIVQNNGKVEDMRGYSYGNTLLVM